MVLILTGLPGIGKTTLMRKVADSLSEVRLAGFLTDEIRGERRRVGFRLRTLDGREATMAHMDFRTPHRVGKYGVDIPAVDQLAGWALRIDPDVDLYLIDEIGKMECLSQNFIARMRSVLDSGKPVVATLARKGNGFIGEVRERKDVVIREVTRQNRDSLQASVLSWIRDTLRDPRF